MSFVVIIVLLTACKKQNDTISDDIISEDVNKAEIISVKNKEQENSNNTASKEGITFVQQDYFYENTVLIEIESDKPCEIYYTMDGSDPDETKELYEEPIKISSSTTTNVYSVKAKGYYEDGTQTDTIVHTYFVGTGVNNRFNTLVFSITTDPYNLYDYEYGIFVEGKLRDDYIKENPYKRIEPPAPANFNIRGRESEREVYLEIFEPDGTIIAGQDAGIRTYGGWSRANLQKSIKIFARKEYDTENNKLRYEFFPDDKLNLSDGTIIDSFKRLVLRNSGNDNGFGFIRDELFQTLAGKAGYSDYHSVRPAALFINGQYHGCYWLHEVYCDEYFEEHYGEYTGTFEILEGGETFKSANEDDSNKYAKEDYKEAYAYTYEDLTDDTVFEKLCEVIDVENYLAYYAIQIFIGNEDWPHNNYKVYRYFPAEGEEYREAPFDGKWRYLLHDLDYSFSIYGTSPLIDNMQKFVSKNGDIKKDSPLFSQLLRREDCKEYFITKTLDLINGAFSKDNLSQVLYEMNSSRMNEQLHMYGKNLIADWVQPEQLPEKMKEIVSYGSDRITYTLWKYEDFFELDKPYKLSVKPTAGSGVKINGIETFDIFEGSYYPNINTVISAIIPAGKELDYWLVNGEAVYDSQLIINSVVVIEEKVDVSYVLKEKAENPRLFISELCSDGDEDYIILNNPYEEDIMMTGYSITDDANELGKLILPARPLKSGESLKILGESNTETSDSKMIRAGFNLRDGETITLCLNGELIDEVIIPDLEDGSIYRRDMKTLRFFEESF